MLAHPQIPFGAFLISIVVLSAWALWSLPLWSRPGMFFAVTVAPTFRQSPEAAQVLRSYHIEIVVDLLVVFALAVAGALERQIILLVFSVLWLAIGPLLAISRGHRRALPHTVAHSTIREASLSPRPRKLPGEWLLQLAPFSILALTGAYVSAHWNQIPDTFPVHWGIDGRANGWSTRTPMGVYGPLFFGAGLVALVSLISYGISHAARRPAAYNDSDKIDPAHRISMALLGVELFLAALLSRVALLPLTAPPSVALIGILVLAMIACVVFLIRWQTHSFSTPASLTHPGDGTPDSCWKLGLFYFNPDDSALFVEKRIGIGYTINFAHSGAWIVLAFSVLLPLALAVFTIVQHRVPTP